MSSLENALRRYNIPVEHKQGVYYLRYPPVQEAHFEVVPGHENQVTLYFFDSLMGSVAPSGKPIAVENDPRAIASAVKRRIQQWNTAILKNPRGASQKPNVRRVVQRYLKRHGM